jgi:hypothetical protein
LLYSARRHDPSNPGVGIIDLERLLGCPREHMEFHVWYLKEKRWIQRADDGRFAITAGGVDAVIENDILVRKDRLLPAANVSSTKTDKSNDLKGKERP